MLAPGLSMRLAPPTSAVSLSRLRRLWQARWIAVSDDEHAVSRTMAGPRAPRKYANRPAAKFAELPVEYVGVEIFLRDPGRQGQHVVVGGQTDENPGLGAADRPGGNSGVLQRFTGDLEQQPLLRIDRRRLARRDGEELRIELVGLPGAQESTLAVADRPRHGVVVGVVLVGIPALRRDPDDAAAAVLQQIPVLLGVVHLAGKTAPDADHGDGLRARLLSDLQPRREFVDLAERIGHDRPGAIRGCGGQFALPNLSESCCSRSSSVRSSYSSTTLAAGVGKLGQNRRQIVGQDSTFG